jgi:hypothetical protein
MDGTADAGLHRIRISLRKIAAAWVAELVVVIAAVHVNGKRVVLQV